MKESATIVFNTKKLIVIFTALLVVLISGVLCLVTYNNTSEVNITMLNKVLVESSELITAKLNITSMTEYKDTGIKVLNRSDFIMVYDATVWAGIDVEKVEIIPNDAMKVIYVTVPKATIQNVKVDSSSIKYFDEKYALFNVNEKEDANKAVVLAEKSVKEEAVKTGILELADKQSVTLIEGLLFKAIPKGYTLEVKMDE